jgi:hypothetical protein
MMRFHWYPAAVARMTTSDLLPHRRYIVPRRNQNVDRVTKSLFLRTQSVRLVTDRDDRC